MSSEVCPFCGKTYKRLKSHLPHCKAAPTSQAPPTEDGIKTNQTTSSSSQLLAGKGETSKQSIVASPKPKKSSVVSASASSAPPQSAELPPSTKKKKQKLSEQIKVAGTQSSISSLPPSPSPAVSTKPKKKSLRALIEAAKPDQVALGSLEGTRSASEEPPSGSTPPRSKTTAPTKGSIIPDSAGFAALSSNTKPLDAPKKKASKTKRAPQSPPAARDTDADDFWADITEEIEESSENKMLLKSGGGHQAGFTIRDARATLGRAKTTSQSGRARILSQAETADELSSKTSLGPGLSPATGPAENLTDVVGCSVPTEAASDQPLVTSPLRPQLQSVTKKSSTSEQASSIPPQRDGSSQPKLLAAVAPLLSGNSSSQGSPATPPPPLCAVGVNGALKAGRHAAELLSLSPTPVHFSRPHVFPLAPQTLPPRAADGWKLEDRKQNSAHNRMEDAVTRRSLAQVRLRELPEWLACRAPRRPRDVVETVQRGWQWYYRRYIDVKKGGVGGVGMLLAGYCVLSYVWSYPHIKCDRWRKYH
ncbi:uncharacterized protein C17orf80 homolog isoform X1 [Scophthalmus maximus]|uniref:ATP synthase subunit f, mitochondrial n=1 Tax=Scophthalmus maximus TaxID=52904 RepID=A0A8D2ZZE8_SCOMX|nr:uncharacterized protein C17orf80 homolog isoform X1 [Scophthalmus maximus]